MRREKNRNLALRLMSICALASMAFLAACSSSDDKSVAGGASGDAGVVAVKDLDVAGVSQKGPFVKGSAVTVQGIDCKTMKFTDEVFEGEVKNNMGEFVVEKVNLSTTCAVVAVTGEYRSEMTGKKVSDKLTLRALTNLKDRTHVNVNLLTNLEYERVMHYVAEKGKTFDEAKDLAETEVLVAFGMAGNTTEFEDLDIFGTSDADATLLAISVLMQGDADVKTLTERMDKFSDSFAESGTWNDDDTKKAIIDWIANAVAEAVMDSIRKNMEDWGFANEVPDFETAVDAFATNVSKEESNDSVKTEGWSWDVPKDARLNPNIKYDSMVDPRDKQVYKVVKIDVPDANYSQVWMAENLNYADSVKTPSLKGSNWCYNNDENNCKVSGRYYPWAAAIDSVALASDDKAPLDCGYGKKCGLDRAVQGICPDGWHLPSVDDWQTLMDYVEREYTGEYNDDEITVAKALASKNNWYFCDTVIGAPGYHCGTNNTSEFNLRPVGGFYTPANSDENPNFYGYYGRSVAWTSTVTDFSFERAFFVQLYYAADTVRVGVASQFNAFSVRCVKNN